MAILSSSCSNTNVLAIVKRLQISLYNCIFTNHLFKYMCYNECTVLEHNVSVLWRRDVYDCVCVRICTSLTNKCDNMVDEIRSSFEYFHSALRLFWASVVEPSWIIPSQTLPTPYIRERLIQYLQRHDWPSGDGLIVEGIKKRRGGRQEEEIKMGLSARTISSMKWRTTFVALALLAFFTYGPRLRKEREQNWEQFGENQLSNRHICLGPLWFEKPEFELLKSANFSHIRRATSVTRRGRLRPVRRRWKRNLCPKKNWLSKCRWHLCRPWAGLQCFRGGLRGLHCLQNSDETIFEDTRGSRIDKYATLS